MNKKVWDERRKSETTRMGADHRSESDRDRARIIHSASFRRLQSKMQLLGVGETDFNRTRLTHSMEVAQVGTSIAENLRYRKEHNGKFTADVWDVELIEAICLAHDLGNPPFGHAGEIALHQAMLNFGGFEGNGQGLRLLCHKEIYVKNKGLNPTRRTLLGILKYPRSYEDIVAQSQGNLPLNPPKCFHADEQDVVDWILSEKIISAAEREEFVKLEVPNCGYAKTIYRSLDASIMNVADDIAYAVYDLEDSVSLGFVNGDRLQEAAISFDKTWARQHELKSFDKIVHALVGKPGKRADRQERKQITSRLIGAFVTSTTIVKNSASFRSPIFKYRVQLNEPAETFRKALNDLIKTHVIHSAPVQMVEHNGLQMLEKLFKAFQKNPELLKENYKEEYVSKSTEKDKHRVICDYVAGMTDEYAAKVYERLFVPHAVSMFEPL